MPLRNKNKPPKHKHDWNLIDKTENPSFVDKALERGLQYVKGVDVTAANERTVVYVFKCDCGEVWITKETL